MILTIRTYPQGPQCWCVGLRVHHGAVGCVLVAAGIKARSPLLLAAGTMLALHDRADAPVWFRAVRGPLPDNVVPIR
jgi:hypothetical protein